VRFHYIYNVIKIWERDFNSVGAAAVFRSTACPYQIGFYSAMLKYFFNLHRNGNRAKRDNNVSQAESPPMSYGCNIIFDTHINIL